VRACGYGVMSFRVVLPQAGYTAACHRKLNVRHAGSVPSRFRAATDQEDSHMSIVDDLVSNLVERNKITLNGAFTISLVDGGVSLKGQLFSTIRDEKKNKDLLNIKAPIAADVKVGDIVIPLPQIR
jgi:hypothetical protein